MSGNVKDLISKVTSSQVRELPNFNTGDTIKVHNKIVEGTKERIQVFEGIVIKRTKSCKNPTASFTVRKVSYNIGVERTFLVHSPRIEKIEVISRGQVRRAKLFYLRPLRGKATKIKSKMERSSKATAAQKVTVSEEATA